LHQRVDIKIVIISYLAILLYFVDKKEYLQWSRTRILWLFNFFYNGMKWTNSKNKHFLKDMLHASVKIWYFEEHSRAERVKDSFKTRQEMFNGKCC